jgi:hypothetical protein
MSTRDPDEILVTQVRRQQRTRLAAALRTFPTARAQAEKFIADVDASIAATPLLRPTHFAKPPPHRALKSQRFSRSQPPRC